MKRGEKAMALLKSTKDGVKWIAENYGNTYRACRASTLQEEGRDSIKQSLSEFWTSRGEKEKLLRESQRRVSLFWKESPAKSLEKKRHLLREGGRRGRALGKGEVHKGYKKRDSRSGQGATMGYIKKGGKK